MGETMTSISGFDTTFETFQEQITQCVKENLITVIAVAAIASSFGLTALGAGASLATIGFVTVVSAAGTVVGMSAFEAFCETSGIADIYRDIIEYGQITPRDLMVDPDDF
jgi:hypothetical protein